MRFCIVDPVTFPLFPYIRASPSDFDPEAHVFPLTKVSGSCTRQTGHKTGISAG
jgi:hypothetical protein